jgi:hypothetical protein
MYNPDMKCVIKTRDVHAWANFEIADVRESMLMFDTSVIPEKNLNTDNEVEEDPPPLEYCEPDSDDDADDDNGGGDPHEDDLDNDPDNNGDKEHHKKTDTSTTTPTNSSRPDLAAGRNENGDGNESGSKASNEENNATEDADIPKSPIAARKSINDRVERESEGWISIPQR